MPNFPLFIEPFSCCKEIEVMSCPLWLTTRIETSSTPFCIHTLSLQECVIIPIVRIDVNFNCRFIALPLTFPRLPLAAIARVKLSSQDNENTEPKNSKLPPGRQLLLTCVGSSYFFFRFNRFFNWSTVVRCSVSFVTLLSLISNMSTCTFLFERLSNEGHLLPKRKSVPSSLSNFA